MISSTAEKMNLSASKVPGVGVVVVTGVPCGISPLVLLSKSAGALVGAGMGGQVKVAVSVDADVPVVELVAAGAVELAAAGSASGS